MTPTKPQIVQWLKDNLHKRKSPNRACSSYALKHIVEPFVGYLSVEDFVALMKRAGFRPMEVSGVSPSGWHWPVSGMSPVIKSVTRYSNPRPTHQPGDLAHLVIEGLPGYLPR